METVPVRINKDLAEKILLIARRRNVQVADLLDAVLRPYVNAEFHEDVNVMRSEQPPDAS